MSDEVKTHDYTKRAWGHDYIYRPLGGDGHKASITGWGHGIEAGHYLLLEDKNSERGSTRYQVDEIEYYRDPPDMWHAKATFAPRHSLSA